MTAGSEAAVAETQLSELNVSQVTSNEAEPAVGKPRVSYSKGGAWGLRRAPAGASVTPARPQSSHPSCSHAA